MKAGLMNNDTVGKIASELMVKSPESRDPIELQREMQKDYLKNLIEAAERGKKEFPGDFFLVVLTKNERLMANVFRNYFFPRLTCPTPDYDQSVFRFNKKTEDITYIWTIPSRDASYHLKDNALLVVGHERDLLNFVLDFDSGKLYKISKMLNGEELDSPLLHTDN